MLDIRFIRDNPQRVQTSAQNKGYTIDIAHIIELDSAYRELLARAEELRSERNQHSAELKGGKPTVQQIEKGKQIKERLAKVEDELSPIETELQKLLTSVPNVARDDVPVGATEDENQVTKTVGEKPNFEFEPKNHWEIGEANDWIDKERAAKVAGSRFAYLKGDLVLLEFALWQFGLSQLTNPDILAEIIKKNGLNVSNKPFVPVLPPAVARTDVYIATGRLNKEEQTYGLADDDLWLNASAEHTLAPMYMNEILEENQFPLRYVGYTTAFRREAGTYGKDNEGILRLHQFNKLEMEVFNLPENSYEEHKFLIAVQEHLMASLDLPYQVVTKCTADIGFPNAAGSDIEVWLPGQGKYRETHTADYIGDFQPRRMQTRVRRSDGKIDIVHTNDATAYSQRPLIAIIENNQTKDGKVRIPPALQPLMGREMIG